MSEAWNVINSEYILEVDCLVVPDKLLLVITTVGFPLQLEMLSEKPAPDWTVTTLIKGNNNGLESNWDTKMRYIPELT